MTSPVELARDQTSLDAASRRHLERLMASWSLLADFSFSDLLLYAPLAPEGAEPGVRRFVVLGQMRPTTSPTVYRDDLVGRVVGADAVPLVRECFRRGAIVAGEGVVEGEHLLVRYQCVPVRFDGRVVGVLSRAWSPTVGRRTGELERVYLRLFESLAAMVSDGVYPFATERAAAEEAPRVGDGVLVLDADRRVTFASPNAVNALHRMGIVSSIVGSTLAQLGVDSEAVRVAFADAAPMTEEIELRPEVVVLARCIPLIEAGRVTGAALLVRDVTDLRSRDRLLLSKDAAIREVHHRVKNNLQTISSLLRLQSRRLEDEAGRLALLEAERRVRAIALVHEILAREPGEQVPFGDIVPALVDLARHANVSPRALEVHVAGEPGELAADVATPLAVVITELLQNAVEHAFAGADGAGQRVDLTFRPGEDALTVEVRDNGRGFPPGFDLDATASLGLAIVRDLVRTQLGGSITIESRDGALVRLEVPLGPRPAAARQRS
ncbi:MAG TPA: sensor histidine kinase [Acidimicrobiales bacterium]|nr:sensor histidine kinase [Acidimicrobiales bacterium]